MKKICAIYTRKSTEERLDMAFNSLDSQREACEAYILSQKSDGWVASKTEYDDGGFSGGTLERPALRRLLDDVKAGKIQIIVVYKIDRLTRSLMDFAKLVEVFDEHGATFISITESFNTTTSVGRLALNVMLSFAQFEREIAGERIRDKIAASKRKGMWMGGVAPVGYKIEYRQLVPEPNEIPTARLIFNRYLALGSVRELVQELKAKGTKSPQRNSLKGNPMGGNYFTRGALYAILRNPAYVGKIRHKNQIHEGLHEGIIDPDVWYNVQALLDKNQVKHQQGPGSKALLKGLIYDPDGVPYSPTFTKKGGQRYCYYVSQNLLQDKSHPNGLIARLPSQEIENTIEAALHAHLPEVWSIQDGAVAEYLGEQIKVCSRKVLFSLIQKITIYLDRLEISLMPDGLEKLGAEHMKLKNLPPLAQTVITALYKTSRAKRGAIIIEPQGKHGILDLPPHELRRLVQGIVWRDEHFNGAYLRDIAKREGYSEAYVGTTIFKSFELLSA